MTTETKQKLIAISYAPSDKPKERQKEWRRALQSALVSQIVEVLSLSNSGIAKPQSALLEEYLQLILIDSKEVPQKIRNLFSTPPFLIRNVSIGDTSYPLRRESAAAFIADYQTFVVQRFQQLDLRGVGTTSDEANADFSRKVHQLFQRLYSLTPGEMTQDERMQWTILSSVIDVEQHEALTPIQFRKIAEVQSTNPFTVRWWGDEDPTLFDLRLAPPKLAALRAGDRFEAVVEFDRNSREIRKILTFDYLQPRDLSAVQEKNGLEGLTKVTLEEIWGD